MANEKTPQHDLNKLSNQMLFLERLHLLYESKKLKKCMLSMYLNITSEYRKNFMNHMGLCSVNAKERDTTKPII